MDERERAAHIGLAVAGDADAMQRLITEYHGALSAIVDARIEPALRRHVTPEDVLQDAYAAANRTVTSCDFAGPAAFYKWLETIVIRKLIDAQKAAAKLPKGESAAIPKPSAKCSSYAGLSKVVADTGNPPSRALRQQEATAALLSSLARLKDSHRNAIRMRFLEEMPVAEIAKRMNTTEPAVYGLCRQGLKSLRQAMDSITRYLCRQ